MWLDKHRRFGVLFAIGFVLICLSGLSCSAPSSKTALPNIVVIFVDDVGYGDIGVYGNQTIRTPNIDRLASAGMQFTDFYVPTSACSPSRAALITGRYPNRTGISNVLGPRSRVGLSAEEVTIAEVLRENGYATAAVGKWHLGDHPQFLPTAHGFDSYFGLPYSNDMSPDVANNPRERARNHPPLPLVRDTTVVEREPDQRMLLGRYTQEALSFIRDHANEPFFLYFAHSAAHVPLYSPPEFAGRSQAGAYGDVIEELDASVGQVTNLLEELDIERQTLVFFTSDNGPWLVMGDHGGSAGTFREGKATSFEGGHRVPAVAYWPGQISAGQVSTVPSNVMDLLPTFASLAGADLPNDVDLDGRDISQLMTGSGPLTAPNDKLYYFRAGNLQAVRAGRWKMHAPHGYATLDGGEPGSGGIPGFYANAEIGWALFDLETDAEERFNVVERYPEKAAELKALIEEGRRLYGHPASDIVGSLQGQPGRIDEPWSEQVTH